MSESSYTVRNESFSRLREIMSDSDLKKRITNASFEGAGTVTRDGETLYRYNATTNEDAEGFLAKGVSTDKVESFNATLLVDQDGIIQSLTSMITYIIGGETRKGTTTYRIADIDSTTVEEPDWIEKAKSAPQSKGTNPFGDGF